MGVQIHVEAKPVNRRTSRRPHAGVGVRNRATRRLGRVGFGKTQDAGRGLITPIRRGVDARHSRPRSRLPGGMGIYLFDRDTLVEILEKRTMGTLAKFSGGDPPRKVQAYLYDGYWKTERFARRQANLQLAFPARRSS